eukprot:1252381-Rhodomonas_salina.2
MREQGSLTVEFEDLVWSLPGGGLYCSRITVSAHIDDLLIACTNKDALELFKHDLCKCFDCTDEGKVSQYLGCEVIFNSKGGKVTLRQKVYAELVLLMYGMWGCVPVTVKTPLEPGTRLSKADSPKQINSALQCRYQGMVGHISFLVSCTRQDLAFAYAELWPTLG